MPSSSLKPPKGSVLNGGHPLAAGLIDAWLFNEGGGSGVLGSVTNRRGTIVGTQAWQTKQFGTELLLNIGGGTAQQVTSPLYATAHPQITVAVIARNVDPLTSPSNSQALFHTSTGGNNGTYFIGYRSGGSHNLSLVKGGVNEAASAIAWPNNDGQYYYAAASSGGTAVAFVLRGLTTQSLATETGVGIIGAEAAGNGTYSLGSYGADTNFAWNGSVVAIFVWKRRILISDLIAHSVNPWQMWQLHRRRNLVALGGAATTLIKPMFVNQAVNRASTY